MSRPDESGVSDGRRADTPAMEGSAYRSYLLTVLLLILAFNYVDRFSLGLLLQDIKADLDLTDTQLGLLNGIAFALFYATMGIPIARWADRGNRVTIISVTTVLWSAALGLCGLAGTFLQLLMIRIGVAVGESGCIPTAHSLIADHFARSERPRAVGIYMLGAPLGVVIGYFLAGWINELYGWRVTFLILGLPGLVMAALTRFTLKDPGREKTITGTVGTVACSITHPKGTETFSQPSVKEVVVVLWGNTTFRHLLLCFSVLSFFGNGLLQWQPAFFIRSYGLQTGELGTWFAVTYGLGGLLGTYCGGEWATRRAANNERLQLKTMAVVSSSLGVFFALVYLSSNKHLAFGLMAVAAVAGAATNGPLFAVIQTLVPERMRAISIAIIYLFANLIGLGLGPLVVGVLSDALRPLLGDESLRYALLAMCPGYSWAGWHLWQGSRTVQSDVAAGQMDRKSAAQKENVVANA